MSDEDNTRDKFVAKFGLEVGKDVKGLVKNLRHNYNVKHKGNYSDLINFLDKPSTMQDWALNEAVFNENALKDRKTLDMLGEVFEDHYEMKMHVIRASRFENVAITRGNLRLMEAYDTKTGILTISFSGTGKGAEQRILHSNYIETLFVKEKFKYGTEGRVSNVIQEMYSDLRPTVLDILKKHGAEKVKFTGYSLGGALAEMAGADTGLGVKNIAINSFATPPFGDAKFAANYPKLNVNRIVNRFDPISFKGGLASRHVTNEVWDVTSIRADDVNNKFWRRPWDIERGKDLLNMTHRGDAFNDAFDAVRNADLLDASSRVKGGAVFNSRVLAFLDAIDLGLTARIEDAASAFKEFFRASRGDTPHFKGLFQGEIMEKIAKAITPENVHLDFPEILELADIEIEDDGVRLLDDGFQSHEEAIRVQDIELEDVAKGVDESVTSRLLEGVEKSDRITPVTKSVVKHVASKFPKNPLLKASKSVARQMAKRAKDARGAFVGSAKGAGKAAKGAAKGILKGLGKAIDVGVLDAVFVGLDIAEDFDRIKDESVFTMWNGVPVHKLYNPEEYAYIEALKVLYNVVNAQEVGVSVDTFVNTWFGRISESEDGSFLIDGEPKDISQLKNGFEFTSGTTASGEGVRLESKEKAVAENVTKGVFGFLIGAAIFTAAAIAAPATGGGSLVAAAAVYTGATAATVGANMAIEAVDEHYEQEEIGERANNFNQAFHRKVLNDHLDVLNSKIVEVFGPLLQAEHSVTWHKELINAALLYKNPEALGKLEEFGYPRGVLETIGKIVRSHVPRIADVEITAESKLSDIVEETTEKINNMNTYFAAEFKVQRELNARLDEIYEDLRGTVNGNLNQLWEQLTDPNNGLNEEEVKKTMKKANDLINIKHAHQREARNELLEAANEGIEGLLEDTESDIKGRQNLQEEINRLQNELESIKGKWAKQVDELAKQDGEQDGEQDVELTKKLGEAELEEIVAIQREEIEKVRARHIQRVKDQERAIGTNLQSGKIEEENVDEDRGLPERETEGRFEPTGKELAFTFDGGMPRMLFEDGSEKSYSGPSNALAGGITQGNWTGVIPNADKPPVNLLDNYFMAYHIENQEDQTLANGRLIKRITRALNSKKITPESNPIEYRVALITLEHIKRYKNIFGIEISNSFMENGLGAVIRDQVYDNITVPLRKGALPVSFSLENDNLEMDVDPDARVNLKRARDVAFAGGDKMMGLKFQRMYADFNDLARVAGEYLGEAQRLTEGVNISGGMERLVLENLQKVEQKEEGIAKLLVSLLNKPLIQVIGK